MIYLIYNLREGACKKVILFQIYSRKILLGVEKVQHHGRIRNRRQFKQSAFPESCSQLHKRPVDSFHNLCLNCLIICSLSECMVHSCHVHVMLYSLSGGSLEPAVTSLETLQACCNFLWNNSGMSIICYFFFSLYWYCACICSQAMMYVASPYKNNDLLN